LKAEEEAVESGFELLLVNSEREAFKEGDKSCFCWVKYSFEDARSGRRLFELIETAREMRRIEKSWRLWK
jgi:hypothetical protein